MTDELGRLESALRATSPQPPAPARERAVAAAMVTFDRRHQGISGETRHMGEVPKRGTPWIRRLAMPISRPYLAFAGVASLAVLAGVVVHLTSVAPSLSPDLALAPASVSPPGAGPGDAAAPNLERSQASGRGAQGLAEGEVARAREAAPAAADQSAEEASAKSHTERQSELYRLLSQERLNSAGGGAADDRREMEVRAVGESLAEAEAKPAQASRSMMKSAGRARISGAADSETYPTRFREQGRDRFPGFDDNPVKVVAEEPVSTFSIDVDTASYGFVRASLNDGVLPQMDAVRVEELINYFPYDYPGPEDREAPFAASVSLMPAPWNDDARLMRIGIKGYALDTGTAPRANLVFLIDTSGSMDEPNKLPLLVNSLKMLLGTLAPEDTVAIVTYAGSAGMALAPTPVGERARILAALDRIGAWGSTAGAEGIRQAYLLAEQHFVEGGINRVILATDGDFNVGITDLDELESYIARQRASGVFLSVLGFGMGNYNDALMQRLAQSGNGNAAYIDSLTEARKALVEESTSMLFPIAKDVKLQVEFNPAAISEYRLIGYETRTLAREDFRNDMVDAGEIGSGHTVTAIYEVVPAGSGAERVEPLRYGREDAAGTNTDFGHELAFVKIRYKLPDAETSEMTTFAVTADDVYESVGAAPREVRFAAAVAGFGQLLRGGRYTGDYGYDDVIALAQGARGEDPFGYRAEFIGLVRLARSAAAMEPLREPSAEGCAEELPDRDRRAPATVVAAAACIQ